MSPAPGLYRSQRFTSTQTSPTRQQISRARVAHTAAIFPPPSGSRAGLRMAWWRTIQQTARIMFVSSRSSSLPRQRARKAPPSSSPARVLFRRRHHHHHQPESYSRGEQLMRVGYPSHSLPPEVVEAPQALPASDPHTPPLAPARSALINPQSGPCPRLTATRLALTHQGLRTPGRRHRRCRAAPHRTPALLLRDHKRRQASGHPALTLRRSQRRGYDDPAHHDLSRNAPPSSIVPHPSPPIPPTLDSKAIMTAHPPRPLTPGDLGSGPAVAIALPTHPKSPHITRPAAPVRIPSGCDVPGRPGW
jgi:hypothetical protein